MSIEAIFKQKNNSLTFIRAILAIFVIFSHSYILSGHGVDPVFKMFKIAFGSFAVESFFVISGFLVTASYLRDTSLLKYLRNRFLRIFPAYWVCLLFCGLILAPFIYFLENRNLTSLQRFTGYITANFFLLIKQPAINGVFSHNPVPSIINGSLWTLFPEFFCYIAIPLMSLSALLIRRKKMLLFLFILYLIVNGIEGYRYGYFEFCLNPTISGVLFEFRRYTAYFLGGVIFFIFIAQKPLSNFSFYGPLVILLASIIFRFYNFIGPILLPYVILGLVAKLPFTNFGKIGDYSYGLYIYSYPIQQTIHFLNPSLKNPIIFFFIAVLFTIPLAFLSWRFIEEPALKLKKWPIKNAIP